MVDDAIDLPAWLVPTADGDAGDAIVRPAWPAPPCVQALATTRLLPGHSRPPFDAFNLGLRSGEDEATVRANRSLLARAFALPAEPHWLRQVHGTRVLRLSAPLARSEGGGWEGHGTQGLRLSPPLSRSEGGGWEGVIEPASACNPTPTLPFACGEREGEESADAAITSNPGVVLAILTADCLPVLFCSDAGDETGAAHAGWRGLSAGVLENTVAAMRTPPERLLAWLGPAAGAQAYEVGEEVRAAFVDADPAAANAFVATRPGHWLCDLYALARLRLAHAGVARVYGGGLCTLTDTRRFYSYRREGATGRMASLIWLEHRER
ncbi:MAG: peptidoglycan editing factor PgeF [Proteobacteria bacterium]|nr:peptidoglycan editing factor PgeF [Pseudomonadota bacterium]